MTIRTFADTSAVSLAYALSDASKKSELGIGQTLHYLPFTTEGFSMSKESVESTAIRGNRRSKGAKNTRGSAAGAATIELGANAFTLDMLQLTMMNTWNSIEGGKTGSKYITDSNVLQFAMFEKTTRPDGAATARQFHEDYYGMAVSDATIDFGDAALITMAMNFVGIFAESNSAIQGTNGMGGSVATSKILPDDYEIADSSNNLRNIVIRDSAGLPLELVFSTAQLQVTNNTREQNGLGSVFASGIGLGKVAVQLSGDVYFYDQTVLDVHMNNRRISASMTIETVDGIFAITLPSLMAQAPTNNAQGENADYTTSLTLVAEEGTVTVGDSNQVCCILITYEPK